MRNFKVYVTSRKEGMKSKDYILDVKAENIPIAVDMAEGCIGMDDKIHGVMENNEYKEYKVCVNINGGYHTFAVKANNFSDALEEAEDRIKDDHVIEAITEVK